MKDDGEVERNATLSTVIMIRKSYLSRQNLNKDLKKVREPVMQLSEGRVSALVKSRCPSWGMLGMLETQQSCQVRLVRDEV